MVANVEYRPPKHCISSGRSLVRKKARVSEAQKKAQTSGPEMRRLTARARKFRNTAGNYTKQQLVEMSNEAIQQKQISVRRYNPKGELYVENAEILGTSSGLD